MTLGWPQLIYLGFVTLCLGFDLAKHGQPRTTKHHFGYSLVAQAGLVALLYWGGFFTGCPK